MQLSVLPTSPVVSEWSQWDDPGKPSDDASAEEVLQWLTHAYVDELAAGQVVATTGFGMEGCVLLDLIHEAGLSLPVHWIDTDFLFAETHELRRRLETRYPRLTFVRHAAPLTPGEQAEVLGPQLWARNPDGCCRVRKVLPMRRAMQGVSVWLAALRRGQSKARATLPLVGRDPQHDVVKICPLLKWTRADVWQYVQAHDVPFNTLHEREYPTVGCTHCTRPVPGSRPDDYSRDGRWAGTGKTECGLHVGGSGI